MALNFVPSIKQKIIKNLAEATRVTAKERANPLYKKAHDLKDAVLFRDIHISKSESQKADQLEDFDHLPYSDFMAVLDSTLENDDGEEVKDEKDAILVRVWRQGEEIYSAFFYRATGSKPADHMYVLVSLFKLNRERNTFETIRVINYRDLRSSFADDMERTFQPVIVKLIYALTHFHPTVKSDPTTTYAITKVVKPLDRPKYIEYTLDLTQPRTIPRASKGGTHASPMEHTRRGHWRTSKKTGKRYFVRDTVVNKGSVRGKIVKDYTM